MMLRTAGGLFVSQNSVFGNNQKLHNAKQGYALTTKMTSTYCRNTVYGSHLQP